MCKTVCEQVDGSSTSWAMATWWEDTLEVASRDVAAACIAAEVRRASLDRLRRAASTSLACSLTAASSALLVEWRCACWSL